MIKKILFTLVFSIVLSGCTQGTKLMTGNLVSINLDENTISIKGYSYDPSESTVKIGSKVSVTNHDAVSHTITADGEEFPSITVEAGETATFQAPDTPGEYKFHCSGHLYMMGTLKVTE